MTSRRLEPEHAAIGTIPNRNIPLIQILLPPIHSSTGRFACGGAGRVLPLLIGWAVAGAWPAFAAQVSLIPMSDKGSAVEQLPMEANDTLVTATAGQAMSYRLDYRHGTGTGTLRLLWESLSHARQPVPADMLHDAWGRFVTNDGKPSDWWLKLTGMAREMMQGKRNPDLPMP